MVSWVLVYLQVGRRIIQHQGHHCLPASMDLALPLPLCFPELQICRANICRAHNSPPAVRCRWKHRGFLCKISHGGDVAGVLSAQPGWPLEAEWAVCVRQKDVLCAWALLPHHWGAFPGTGVKSCCGIIEKLVFMGSWMVLWTLQSLLNIFQTLCDKSWCINVADWCFLYRSNSSPFLRSLTPVGAGQDNTSEECISLWSIVLAQ